MASDHPDASDDGPRLVQWDRIPDPGGSTRDHLPWLRIFIDKSLIEVFANDRIATLSPHRYEPGNVGITLFAEGAPIRVEEVQAWRMRPISARR